MLNLQGMKLSNGKGRLVSLPAIELESGERLRVCTHNFQARPNTTDVEWTGQVWDGTDNGKILLLDSHDNLIHVLLEISPEFVAAKKDSCYVMWDLKKNK